MSTAINESADRLKHWTVSKALPLWAERARLDDDSWVEHLHLNGTADQKAERRWRVLARQVYVYAQAKRIGWFDGLGVAQTTYAPMRKVGQVHRVAIDGTITNDRRDFYDHAFYVLASASLYAATQDEKYLKDAEGLLDWIDTALSHEDGGWAESPDHEPLRRQNPHMHLLEASLYLHGATGQPKHLKWARTVYALFETHFYDAETQTVREFFGPRWNDKDEDIEPGHAMEWVWLLWQYERATGIDTSAYRKALYAKAQTGRGPFLNDLESKHGEIVRETRRLWVQTEVIKAHLAMAEAGTPGSAELAAAVIDKLMVDYLTPDGLWHDKLNACGANLAETIPVSTFYHILCMAIEAERVARVVSA